MAEYTYNKVSAELVEEFRKIVLVSVYVVGEEINEDFFHDEMPIYGQGRPEVVIDATTTEDIAAIVKLCYEHNIPVIPRGAGTANRSCGGSTWWSNEYDKNEQNLEYDYENFVVRVEPGVLLNDLAEDTQKQGLLYPPDPRRKICHHRGKCIHKCLRNESCKIWMHKRLCKSHDGRSSNRRNW